MSILGIDVSHWQGRVNWTSVADSEVKFAFAKASEGVTVDATFKDNWGGIQDVGLFRGAYHYGRPGNDPETQAVHFASVVGPLGFRDLPPVLDLEQSDGKTAAQVLDWARRFVATAEQHFGRQLIVYTGQFWRGPLGNPAADDFFSKRSLWLAGYVSKEKLSLPKTWAKWTLWQYSDGTLNAPVRVPGVARCDQNHFDGDEAALERLCSGESPLPPRAPDVSADNAWPAGAYFVWPRTPAVAGPAVKAWQRRLLERGYALDADGVYGPQSRHACMAFQRNEGLVPDGIVGPGTWKATFAQ